MATIACSGGRALTAQGTQPPPGRSQLAPSPAAACQQSPRNGAAIAPATGRSSSTSATDTPTAMKPWTKLVVPSSGSTTQRRPSTFPPSSSPWNGISGAASPRNALIARSLARSASVTQSPGSPLVSPALGARLERTTSAPSSAAARASWRIRSSSTSASYQQER